MDKEKALYRCADILVHRYGFTTVDVRNIAHELWLSHPSRKRYNLIRCSIDSGFQLKNVDERTQQILQAITTVFQTDLSFCDVVIDDASCAESANESGTRCILAPIDECPTLFAEFPLLKEVFKETPEEDLETLKSKLKGTPKTARTPKNIWQSFTMLPKATAVFLVLIVGLWLLVNILSWMGHDLFASAILLGAYYKPFMLAHHEYWRLLTTGFMHTDFLHLAMNALALVNLGNFMERLYGPKKMTLTLIIGIIMGSLFVFAGESTPMVIGISGGLYAILGILLVYLVETGLIRQPQIQAQVLRMVLMNLLINFLPAVSYLGHLGGLIAGVLLGLGFAKQAKLKPLKTHAFIAIGLLFVALSALALRNPKPSELYPGTDRLVIEMAQNIHLTSYAQSLDQALKAYYLENR